MAAKIPYIYQLPLQLGVAMWNVRSDVCHLQFWGFRPRYASLSFLLLSH